MGDEFGSTPGEGRKRSPEDVAKTWRKWAMAVHATLHTYKPAAAWKKPASLPSLLKVRAAQDKLRMGSTSKKARELVGEYNVWLDTVLRTESENTGMMVVLLQAYCLLEGGHRDEVQRYLMQHWCRKWIEPTDGRNELDDLARWQCRNESILPTWLLNGNPVPDAAYDEEGLGFDRDKFASEFDDDRPRAPSSSSDDGEQLPMPDFNVGSRHD